MILNLLIYQIKQIIIN